MRPLEGHTPLTFADRRPVPVADLGHVRWVSHCRGLVQLLAASGRHLRILTSEISRGEEIDEMLHGRIGLMIRFLDLGRLRGSIFRSALKERVR